MKEKKMVGKITRMGLGAAMVLLSLAVLGGCSQPDDGTKENTEQIQVTNIPPKVGNKDSYKVFVQVSAGATAEAGWVAKGDAVINGKNAVTMDLKDAKGKPWAEQGSFNIAVVISPKAVTTWEDIDVYGGSNLNFSSKIYTFTWGSGFHLNDIMPTQVEQLFNGKGLTAPDQKGIICVPESGIDYPPGLAKP
jgi:hypothetical protein